MIVRPTSDTIKNPTPLSAVGFFISYGLTTSGTNFPSLTEIKPRSAIFNAGLTGSDKVLIDMMTL